MFNLFQSYRIKVASSVALLAHAALASGVTLGLI